MKHATLFFVLLFSIGCFAQMYQGPYLQELRGMDDYNGNTHLFYRYYSYRYINEYIYSCDFPMWHWDIAAGKDTMFFPGYSGQTAHVVGSYSIDDFQFWDSDPTKYICCVWSAGIDGSGFVRRYDSENESFYAFQQSLDHIYISHVNDSIITVAGPCIWGRSSNGGWDWDTLYSFSHSRNLLGVYPKNDSVLYYCENNCLFKSNNLLKTSYLIDSLNTSKLLFDKDNKHLYRIVIRYGDWKRLVYVSDNEGEPGTWKQVYTCENGALLAVDNESSGVFYVADGKDIIEFSNYGNAYRKVKKFDKSIVGLYKKPGTNILYAATHFNIYKITGDSAETIKSLAVPEHNFDYYPLAKNNRWIYSTKQTDNTGGTQSGCMVKEITGDTLMPNGKMYFIIHEKNIGFSLADTFTYERVDSLTGLVYKYYNNSGTPIEIVTENLIAEEGDTLILPKAQNPIYDSYMCGSATISQWGIANYALTFESLNNLSNSLSYTLVQNYGLKSFSQKMGNGITVTAELKGCIKNNKMYGDTLVTDVKQNPVTAPVKYELLQNYPNPFNPTTNIEYSIAKAGRVELSVYNVLGQKIAQLVNQEKPAGKYRAVFSGQGLPSGIYFYRLTASGFAETRKFVLMK